MANAGFRFFTKPIDADGVAGHLWCWARLDARGQVIDSGSGYYTIVAAMQDARAHGFTGPDEPGDPQVLLDRFGDRRAFAICTS